MAADQTNANPNTKLWETLKHTPDTALKDFRKGGGFRGKSIDPVYRIYRLTEQFGPVGRGWLFIEQETWREEIPLSEKDRANTIAELIKASRTGGVDPEMNTILSIVNDMRTPVVYVKGYLVYGMDNGEGGFKTCSHTGGTVVDRAADEAYKMAETDAIGKCCLDIGVSADVYLGLHDGDKYQKQQNDPTNPNSAADRLNGSASGQNGNSQNGSNRNGNGKQSGAKGNSKKPEFLQSHFDKFKPSMEVKLKDGKTTGQKIIAGLSQSFTIGESWRKAILELEKALKDSQPQSAQ